MAARFCVLRGCMSRESNDVNLYRFTTKNNLREVWLANIGDPDLSALNKDQLSNRCLCQKHFERKYINNNGKLTFDARPTLFKEDEITSGVPRCGSSQCFTEDMVPTTHIAESLSEPEMESSSVKINILIGVTGSVATIKLPLLIEKLKQLYSTGDISIKVVSTAHAFHFFDKCEIPNSVKILDDTDEWKAWRQRGDPVLHIDLTKWADIFLIAPLDANTLAKVSQGICDNLLTCTLRAWSLTKPLIFCPAMNTQMWEHPITKEQVDKLKSWGYIEVPCISKKLMCGDTGMGAMADVDTIADAVKTSLAVVSLRSLMES